MFGTLWEESYENNVATVLAYKAFELLLLIESKSSKSRNETFSEGKATLALSAILDWT